MSPAASLAPETRVTVVGIGRNHITFAAAATQMRLDSLRV